MHAFVSTIEMKTDAKGRVSIPKPFRDVLKADGFEGLYCIPSPDGQSLDAGGKRLFAMFEEKLAALDPTSFDYDLLATAFFGESEVLSLDKEGRIVLPQRLKDVAGIDSQIIFVGKGHKFQIWSPERYQAYRAQAVSAARRVLWGDQASVQTVPQP
ncbi:division/cell wall cluster transcriptional repressor MraZ [Ahrensia marina]|uniref:division/cell wall cluster transcriptional repressor MraZ n=1 Tax=Ahrensia marina TaxID=1514904 RepID=UPI0035D03A5E